MGFTQERDGDGETEGGAGRRNRKSRWKTNTPRKQLLSDLGRIPFLLYGITLTSSRPLSIFLVNPRPANVDLAATPARGQIKSILP